MALVVDGDHGQMRRVLWSSLALLAILGFGVSACGSGSGSGDAASTTATDASTTTVDGHGGRSGTPVRVYFVRGENLATGGSQVSGETVGRSAIEALLQGPEHTNQIAGLVTMIPDGTELLGLEVAEGTATIDLSEEFTSGGGSSSMMLRTGQVVFTLTQFPTVERVEFLIEGEQVDGLGGEGLPTSYDGRGSFADVTPPILAETPTPHQQVSSPITISGMSNTFEAAFRYSVRTTEGALLAEGARMATSGSGMWGTFEIEAEVAAYEGDVVITLWEESMEDGGDRLNIYEVPVTLG